MNTAMPAECAATTIVSPAVWIQQLSAPPVIDSRTSGWSAAQVQLWRGVAPASCPALDHHCLTLHLGRPRTIQRFGPLRMREVDVKPGALSFTPAGVAFDWQTTGPVDCAELYVDPNTLVADESVSAFLSDCLGVRDTLVEAVFKQILQELEVGREADHLFLDSLFSVLWIRLSRRCAKKEAAVPGSSTILSGRRLKHVIDYIEEHLASHMTIGQLAEVASLSVFHFSRTFAAATGSSPYAFVLNRRIERAQRLLAEGKLAISGVSAACGFNSSDRLSRIFKRLAGVTPQQFRRAIRG